MLKLSKTTWSLMLTDRDRSVEWTPVCALCVTMFCFVFYHSASSPSLPLLSTRVLLLLLDRVSAGTPASYSGVTWSLLGKHFAQSQTRCKTSLHFSRKTIVQAADKIAWWIQGLRGTAIHSFLSIILCNRYLFSPILKEKEDNILHFSMQNSKNNKTNKQLILVFVAKVW